MQIVVRQTSGLGNQLFQYAAGFYLARKHGASLRIAHEVTKNLHKHGVPRPVMLQKFAVSAPIGAASAFDRFVLSPRRQFAAAGKLVRAVAGIQIIRESADAQGLQQDFPVARAARIVYIQGYWQAYWIVREVEQELRREFSLRQPLVGKSLEIAERIRACRNPISVHLRRGDYLTVFGTSAVLPTAYYTEAVRLASQRHGESTFFIFSDDPAYARELFGEDPRFILVDHNDAYSANEDLVLMSLCHHHIIANSTFSWWGAWLNPRPDKQVIAPSKWLGTDTEKTALSPPGWTLVGI